MTKVFNDEIYNTIVGISDMRQSKRGEFSEFEKGLVGRIEKVIRDKKKSVRAFAAEIGMPTYHLHDMLNMRQHMNLWHLGKILEGIKKDLGAVIADELYIPARKAFNYVHDQSVLAAGMTPKELSEIKEMARAMAINSELRSVMIGLYFDRKSRYFDKEDLRLKGSKNPFIKVHLDRGNEGKSSEG